MLKKAHRLTSQEVESAVKAGRRGSSGLFSFHIMASNKAKIAVIIPKKVAKLSVTRHRHKRRIMNALGKYTLPQSYIVLTLRQDISKLDFKELCAHIEGILAKA